MKTPAFHEATFVTGLGDVSNRFFEYIIFLYANEGVTVPTELSNHQIDNKKFPLEILMYVR